MGTSKILIDGVGIDLTQDTVAANKMLSGIKAHDNNGDSIMGTISSKAAATYTPTTTDQTIAAGQYLSGAQTIKGDANLIASNIKTGATIFGVEGTLTPGITPTGNIQLTAQTGTDVTSYATASVRGASIAINTPSINSSTGVVTASAALSTSGWIGSAPSSKTLQLSTQAAATITPSTSSQTAVAAGKYTLGAITVAATPTETKSVTTNGDVTPSTGKFLSKVTVNVPTGTARSSSDLTVSGATVNVPAGLYSAAASKSVATMTLPTSAASTSSGTSKATISRSTADQYINIPTGYNSTAAYYKISATPSGTEGTPVATKGSVTNHAISVTPSVTNTSGYISGGTKTGSAVTVSASELVSGTVMLTTKNSTDVTNYQYATVAGTTCSPSTEIGSDYLGTTTTSYEVSITPKAQVLSDGFLVAGTYANVPTKRYIQVEQVNVVSTDSAYVIDHSSGRLIDRITVQPVPGYDGSVSG